MLQVNYKATCSERKAARDKLLLVHHPDNNFHPDDIETASENFRIILIALKKLFNVAAKKVYLCTQRRTQKKVVKRWNTPAKKKEKRKEGKKTLHQQIKGKKIQELAKIHEVIQHSLMGN